MSFLYPGFLWALAGLSIPILIHLFNFRQTTRVLFSNTRFLRHIKESTTTRRNLKHYLILASRLLFLLFLVLAFAQPFIPAKENMANNRNIIVYLDNSQSMSAQMGNKTRGIDAGTGFIRDIASLFPPDTRFKLITNDFAPFSNTYKTKAEVLDLLAEIRLSPVSRTLQEVNERIRQDESREKEIFWISDFQQSTLGAVPVIEDTLSRLHLVPITLGSAPNIFIDTVYLENPFAAGGEKNVLKVKVRNDGNRSVEQLNLKLTINNVQAATTAVNVPEGGVTETGFDLTTGLNGLNKARLSFNDFPVSFDNEFYIALNFTEKIHVIEIKNTTAVTPIERVYGNKAIFSYRGFSVGNFNYSLLDQADLVVVNGLPSVDQSLTNALREYTDRFGTILFIPAPKADVISYQQLTGRTLKLATEVNPQELDKPDFSNPFFENVFEERSVSLAMPKADRMLDWGADRSPILKFRSNEPFLSRFDQRGKFYLMASPLESQYTDFFNNALFVPVMYRIATTSRKNDAQLYYTLKENFVTLRLDSLNNEEPIRLLGEQELVPSQRKVQDQVMLDIPKFSMAQGFYVALNNRDTVSLLAFNLDKAESQMAQYSGPEVKTMLGNSPAISIFESGSADSFSNEIKARYLGTPLWKYALILALSFLLAEVLLIRLLK